MDKNRKDRKPTDYRQRVELLPQTIFQIDEKGHFTFANRSGFRAFGKIKRFVLKDKALPAAA